MLNCVVSQTNQTLQNLPNLSQEASKTVLNSVIDAIDGKQTIAKTIPVVYYINRNEDSNQTVWLCYSYQT